MSTFGSLRARPGSKGSAAFSDLLLSGVMRGFGFLAGLKNRIQGSFNLRYGVVLFINMIDRAAPKEPVQAGLYTAVWGIWDGRMQQ